MKGPLHQRLRKLLLDATVTGICTQESLGRAMGEKSQTSVGAYLKEVKGGALDLDEAALALEHIGSSLPEFLAGMPPRGLRASERLARELEARPELQAFLQDLLLVPKTQLGDVVELAHGAARVAIALRGARTRESRAGAGKERRTKSARAKRR